MPKKFDRLLVLGRPAGGKSEFIDFLHKADPSKRINKYFIGKFEALDDFLWVWEKFEEDNIWEKTPKGRIFSKRIGKDYGTTEDYLFPYLIERFNIEVPKKYPPNNGFYNEGTLLIEFARGGNSGYKDALNRLSREILENSAILYIKVSFEESWRRNVARYNEKLKHSILAHMVPRETMERYYLVDDWEEYTQKKDSGVLTCNSVKIPFVTMNNEPESADPVILDERYGTALGKLMELKNGISI